MDDFTDTRNKRLPRVLCCLCGISIENNPTNMCANCIRTHVNITEEFPRELTLSHCRTCDRYLHPPSFWSKAPFESKEMMELCLKRIKGLHKVKLVDVAFVWTEPHSRRVKLNVKIQKEIFEGAIIQQGFFVEYVVRNQQCEMCQYAATGQVRWDSVVQLRQKASHRRTFLYLEQIIMRHEIHRNCTRIQLQPDGLDFFFGHRMHGMRFLEFVQDHVPVHRKNSVQLVSADLKSNTAVTRHAFCAEIAPICREDLVFLPQKICFRMGGLGPLVLCHKIYSNLLFLDPLTLRVGELLGAQYWKRPFPSVSTVKQLIEFFVLDIRILPGYLNGVFQLADAVVTLASELGKGREWVTKTHLGHQLHPGSSVMGYLLPALNVSQKDFNTYMNTSKAKTDVMLVHKYFPSQKAKRRRRKWRLRRLTMENASTGKTEEDERREEEEEFMDELERDKEYRRDTLVHIKVKKRLNSSDPVVSQGEESEYSLCSALDALNIDEGAESEETEG